MDGRTIEHLHTLAVLWTLPRRSRADLLRAQNRKLRFLVQHAFRNVPYYRRRFAEAGLGPELIRSAADLQRLPVTTKADLRAQPLDAITDREVDPRTLITRYTAGSTGEPVSVRRSVAEEHLLNMFRIRALSLLGRRLRDRTAHVRSPGVPSDRLAKRPRWIGRLPALRTIDVDCLRPVPDVARDLARAGADVVHGYANVLAEVADIWRRTGGHQPGPRLVFCGGEALDAVLRARIRTGFHAPVFNIYGSHEFNLIAWECAATGALHLCDDNVIVEVVRDGQPVAPGESGEMLVTGLHSYAAPYIRYALGDIVTRGTAGCACGLPFATITEVRGRTMDYVVLDDGRKMHHWELIPMAFWDLGWHRRYQLVQAIDGAISLRLVSAGALPAPAAVVALEAQVRQRMGPGGRFQIEFVDDLAFTDAGKHRLCVSNVHVREGARSS